jgi:hypothetical protein
LKASKTHGLLHSIKAGFLDDDGRPFPSDIEHVFGRSCYT